MKVRRGEGENMRKEVWSKERTKIQFCEGVPRGTCLLIVNIYFYFLLYYFQL